MKIMGIFDIFKSTQKPIKQAPEIEPVDSPIEGYKMIYLFKNVKVRRMGEIPNDAHIGSKVVLMHESATKYVSENISLLLVPQRKRFGYIDDNIEKEIIRCIKHSDKSIARITYFSKKPYEYNSTIDIAFFKKNK